jgi:hypothetical protein
VIFVSYLIALFFLSGSYFLEISWTVWVFISYILSLSVGVLLGSFLDTIFLKKSL